MSPKQQGTCGFCDYRGRLSKEHIWPDWARDYLPPTSKTAHAVSSTALTLDGPTENVRRKALLHNRAGDNRGRTLRIACEACNNGWMSQLQVRARPFLEPLLNGVWSGIDRAERKVLAAWCIMYTMVVEFADPPTQFNNQGAREYLRRTQEPPRNWTVWLGRAKRGDRWQDGFNHHIVAEKAEKLDAHKTRIISGWQSTATVACNLYIQTHSAVPSGHAAPSSFADKHGLVVLWPDDGKSLQVPTRELTAMEASAASNAFAAAGVVHRHPWETE